ncbi:MAG: ornithine carbamoyltransferase [Halobacteriales archaeon]
MSGDNGPGEATGAGVRHFLDVDDLPAVEPVLDLGGELKAAHRAGEPYRRLPDRTLAMLFEKPSTRTRISFETGMTRLGGHALMLAPEHTQLGRGEPLSDTARVLSRYVDAVMVRTGPHETVAELAAHATVPIVNGLTDDAHPCQTLADLLTIREAFGGFADVSAAWVGDGNNVAQSFAVGAAMVGLDLTVATPPGYELDETVLERAADHPGTVETTHDPAAAVAGADVVYTDVWVSMGQDAERERRLADFEGFQVNAELLERAAPDARVLHCLPAHRGEEITEAVLLSDASLVWDQAENRMHAQNGLLVWLLDRA